MLSFSSVEDVIIFHGVNAIILGCTLQIKELQLQHSKHQCAKHKRATHQPWEVEVQSTLALPKALQINCSIHQLKNFDRSNIGVSPREKGKGIAWNYVLAELVPDEG